MKTNQKSTLAKYKRAKAKTEKILSALYIKGTQTYLQHFGGEVAQKNFALNMINEQIMFAKRDLANLAEELGIEDTE